MAERNNKSVALAAAALVGFGAVMLWMMSGPSTAKVPPAEDPDPTPAETPTATDTPAAATAAEHAAPPAAAQTQAAPTNGEPVDLFAGGMPDFMADAHRRVLAKEWLDVEDEKALYKFGQEHKDDARPQLLLAWESMNREWYGIAVRMYRIAYQADPRAKDDPSMLRDLIDVAGRYDKLEFDESVALMKDAYGAAALPRVDQALAAARAQGDVVRAARLQRARTTLAAN